MIRTNEPDMKQFIKSIVIAVFAFSIGCGEKEYSGSTGAGSEVVVPGGTIAIDMTILRANDGATFRMPMVLSWKLPGEPYPGASAWGAADGKFMRLGDDQVRIEKEGLVIVYDLSTKRHSILLGERWPENIFNEPDARDRFVSDIVKKHRLKMSPEGEAMVLWFRHAELALAKPDFLELHRLWMGAPNSEHCEDGQRRDIRQLRRKLDKTKTAMLKYIMSPIGKKSFFDPLKQRRPMKPLSLIEEGLRLYPHDRRLRYEYENRTGHQYTAPQEPAQTP